VDYNPIPTVGRIVQYTLSSMDADMINRRRAAATAHISEHRETNNGVMIHTGNAVAEGDVFPMIITRVWGNTPESGVSGLVMLDGSDMHWATSVCVGTGPRYYAWPIATH
jgi:hypothetical protein